MKDIPVFATELGVASLTLSEIPVCKRAYIKIQSTACLDAFLEECTTFCRMAGAEQIYASGHDSLQSLPLHAVIVEMQCSREALPDTDAALFPVQENTLSEFVCIYNEKAARIPNAAYLTTVQAQQMQDGYFVHRDGKLLGIGRASGDTIGFLASVMPGAGQEVLSALAHAITTDVVKLEVATANEKAMALYARMGFVTTSEVSRWYCVK